MRKFIVSMIILIIVAGVAFFFGWVQIQLPENTYAVAFTKTGGWDEQVIEPGVFTWRWERLIPTNMTLHLFELSPYGTTAGVESGLPSGEVYAEGLPEQPDFTYRVSLSVSYRVKPSALPRLVTEEQLSPDGLESWYEGIADRIAQRTMSLVKQLFQNPNAVASADEAWIAVEDAVVSGLQESFSYLDFVTIVPKEIRVPDLDLYREAKQLYMDLLDTRRDSLAAAIREQSQERVQDMTRIELLEKYGELLTKYPVLLQYLQVEQAQGSDPFADIPGLPTE